MSYKNAKLAVFILVALCVILAITLGGGRQRQSQSYDLAYAFEFTDNQTLTSHVIPELKNPDKIKRTTRIPKIIHQFWDDEIIPTEFVDNIRSLVRDNRPPDWQYYFWTMKTARALIKNKYPEFLKIFDNYPDNLSRADAMRYVVLYEYGGVYFDLDTVSVKPLDPFLQQHLCAFVQEPDEHLLVYGVDYQLTNSAMLCRPRHPIFTFILDKLPSIAKECHNAYDCTGPAVLTKQYMDYKAKPYDYINVVPTDLFQDRIFIRMRGPQIRQKCNNLEPLNKVQKAVCETWKARGEAARAISPNAFTYHTYHYSHRTGAWKSVTFKRENNITKIVPHLKMYTG